MAAAARSLIVLGLASAAAGCGTAVPRIPEVYDLVADEYATQDMEMQVKRAIYCELRAAVQKARGNVQYTTTYRGKVVSTAEDQPVPDSWGVQSTLKFTVEEASKVSSGATYTWNLGKVATDTFSLGAGGQVSSTATRTDTFESFYTISELYHILSEQQVCENPNSQYVGPPSHSSPFVTSELGILDWLPSATETSAYLKSSRSNPNGEGPPLGSGGAFVSDSFSYDVKFAIVSDFNITPSWKLVRVSTSTSPFLDTSRTRTHELILTIGPSSTVPVKDAKGKTVAKTVVPSDSAAQSHLAQQIGSAVATSLRPVLTSGTASQ
ncbi:hypothetical protein ABIF73_000839 [Bradyrhizobium japonicum]|uniref:hypothetical protein n=1 Tax=Bradyrhizobium japonicum TaxID=375 RepID=UPI0033959CDC